MKRLSVVIPTYQHAQTLGRCLESLFAQTRIPDEIIVVDDGSTDDTKKIVEGYGHHVQYFFQENQGAPAARNFGAQKASGDYILFCDADVLASPTMLQKMEQALETHTEVSYAYCGMSFGHKRFTARTFDPRRLRQQNYIHTTSLIRAQAHPRFDVSLKRFQDWDLWLTFLAKGKIGIAIDVILFSIMPASHRTPISHWLPSFLYKIPWSRIGWMPASIRSYQNARDVIRTKHHL